MTGATKDMAQGAADTACGGSAAANVGETREQPCSAPAACTLRPRDFKRRIEWIRTLAGGSLREVRREPEALHLTYDAAAADRVREMVAKEQACCAFLRFDLREDARGVHLGITAPPEAREAADELFAVFAPELARSESQLPSIRKEPDL